MNVTESAEIRKADRQKILCWLLWWQIDASELRRQVEGYGSLGPFGSIRGLCLVVATLSGAQKWFLAGAFITLGLKGRSHGVVLLVDSLLLAEGFLMFLLGWLVYRGKPKAMIGMMALWTFSIAWFAIWYVHYQLLSWGFYFDPIRTSVTLFIFVVGWAVGMHAFYMAREVERARTAA